MFLIHPFNCFPLNLPPQGSNYYGAVHDEAEKVEVLPSMYWADGTHAAALKWGQWSGESRDVLDGASCGQGPKEHQQLRVKEVAQVSRTRARSSSGTIARVMPLCPSGCARSASNRALEFRLQMKVCDVSAPMLIAFALLWFHVQLFTEVLLDFGLFRQNMEAGWGAAAALQRQQLRQHHLRSHAVDTLAHTISINHSGVVCAKKVALRARVAKGSRFDH